MRRKNGLSASRFDFSEAMRLLCVDISQRMEDFCHIRMDNVLIASTRNHRNTSHGLIARLTPMRFASGSLSTTRNQARYTIQRVVYKGHEILYIITFYLPRFLNQSFKEKLISVFHELRHISPGFDGTIRTLPGRFHVHTSRMKEYDRQARHDTDQYLALRPPVRLTRFLMMKYREIESEFGAISSLHILLPKLIPLNTHEYPVASLQLATHIHATMKTM